MFVCCVKDGCGVVVDCTGGAGFEGGLGAGESDVGEGVGDGEGKGSITGTSPGWRINAGTTSVCKRDRDCDC